MTKHKLIADLLSKVDTALHLTHFFDVNEIPLAKWIFPPCMRTQRPHYEIEAMFFSQDESKFKYKQNFV